MHPAPDLLVGDQGKKALDLIDPRRASWCEVYMPAWPLCQPVSDRLGLVRGVIVHHEMHVEIARDAGLYLVEEFPELA
jgi:hypothetical protein